MKCSNCQKEIPPEFSWAIQNNKCPRCGQDIMTEDQKLFLADLSNGLATEMSHGSSPAAIANWILSNYRIEKVLDKKGAGFVSHIEPSNESVKTIYKNAGVSFQDSRKKKIADLIKEVEKANEGFDSEYDNESEDIENDEYLKAVRDNMVSGADIVKQEQIQSLPGLEDLEAAVENNPILNEDRRKRLDKQNQLEIFGKVGKISRSE